MQDDTREHIRRLILEEAEKAGHFDVLNWHQFEPPSDLATERTGVTQEEVDEAYSRGYLKGFQEKRHKPT